MAFRALTPAEFEWIERPHEPGEPPRHVVRLSERMEFANTRANVWRYEPGAKGVRHREPQEETFVVLSGTLSMYLGEPPERVDVPAGGVVRVEPETELQSVNHGDVDLLVYAYGAPADSARGEILESAI